MDQARRASIFSDAAVTGAPRRRARVGDNAETFHDARAAGAGARDPSVQTRRALVAARRRASGILRNVMMAAREQVRPDDVPMLSAGTRIQWEPAQNAHVLLYPEGMVKLSQSAAEILKRVDGASTVDGIVASLQQAFPGAELRADVLEFIAIARARGW